MTEGESWRKHGVTKAQVVERNKHMADGAPELWNYIEEAINDAVEKGYLAT